MNLRFGEIILGLIGVDLMISPGRQPCQMLVKTKPSFGTATLVIASYRLGWLEKHHLDGFGIETAHAGSCTI